jgi:hypothetical protein
MRRPNGGAQHGDKGPRLHLELFAALPDLAGAGPGGEGHDPSQRTPGSLGVRPRRNSAESFDVCSLLLIFDLDVMLIKLSYFHNNQSFCLKRLVNRCNNE